MRTEIDIKNDIEKEPSSTLYHELFECHLSKNLLGEALHSIGHAIKLDPQNSQYIHLEGFCYQLLNRHNKAIESFNTAIQMDSNPRSYFLKGKSLYKIKLFEKAIEAYKISYQLNPDDHELRYELGLYYLDLDKNEDALDHLTAAIQLREDLPEPYYDRGLLLTKLQQYVKARSDFDKLGTLYPDDKKFLSYYQIGNTYFYEGTFEKAVEYFSKSLELYPDDPQALLNRGNAYRQLSEFDLAIENYSQAIIINPDYGAAYGNRADLNQRLGNVNLAIQDYETLMNKKQATLPMFQNLSLLYFSIEDFNGAEKCSNIITTEKPDFASGWYQLARIYVAQNENKKGKKALKKALKIKPEFKKNAKEDKFLSKIV